MICGIYSESHHLKARKSFKKKENAQCFVQKTCNFVLMDDELSIYWTHVYSAHSVVMNEAEIVEGTRQGLITWKLVHRP